MLFTNIDKKSSACNGTRLIVTQLRKHIIEAKIISEINVGHKIFISRMVSSVREMVVSDGLRCVRSGGRVSPPTTFLGKKKMGWAVWSMDLEGGEVGGTILTTNNLPAVINSGERGWG
ncbi:uncharacterized protein LOC120008720 [Tripterygium wilfordii]|uniref:uncharacterized protein LOC120008720 n=1 Tax=Tripterygium wilfordii TaxID=458696 RepID=UPI0018F80FD6|nr:uncharacterized protein LOC120008720 [Tripterygium wilfordii]